MTLRILSFLFLLTSSSYCYGQAAGASQKAASRLPDEQLDLQRQLLPLDSIVAIAVRHSPSVKFQRDVVDADEAQVEFTKKQWSNNVVGFVNYSGGNQNIVSADSQTPGATSSSDITSGFRVGIQINLPLFELVGRKSQVKVAKFQLNSAVSKKEESEQSIKTLVIQFYYDLLYANNLLAIRNEARQSTINQYQIAEKEFKDGIIDVGELSRLKTIEINASADYEDAKRQFSTLYAQIEPTIGVPVEQLMVKR
jgi:outer membrane protein TolC